MNQPPSVIADLVQLLDPDLREDYEERAGIMEFDANQPRELAECLALLEVLRRHPGALLRVTALQVEFDGTTRYVITTDRDWVRQYMAASRVVELSSVITAHFGGMSLLTRIW